MTFAAPSGCDEFPGGSPPGSSDDPLEIIRSAHDATLFVEASAGTGKTYALVERIASLIVSGRATIGRIAAITFTEAAASELRDRVRRKLRALASDMHLAPLARDRVRAALLSVNDAEVTTLHGFARRILAEHPLTAGLPPLFDVVDEVAADLEREKAWSAYCRTIYADVRNAPMIILCADLGLRPENMQHIVARASERWHDFTPDIADPTSTLPTVSPREPTEVLAGARRVCGLLRDACKARDLCATTADTLYGHLGELDDRARELDDAIVRRDVAGTVALLVQSPMHSGKKMGRQQHWNLDDLDTARAAVTAASVAARNVVHAAQRECVEWLLDHVILFVVGEARRRRTQGTLEFHDLLVLCMSTIRSDAHLRAELRERWTSVLIDEFQDTDPLQLRIARLLATQSDGDPLEGGRLFFVGDPKQSIYRFRNADIAVYEEAKSLEEVVHVTLSVSYRATRPIVDWTNAVFGKLIAGGIASIQPSYSPLVHHPDIHIETEPHRAPSVRTMGGPIEGEGLASIRNREAADIASACRAICDEEWAVREPSTGEWRGAHFGDIAILVPRRTHLAILTRKLEDAGVPYQIESSSLALATQQVRDLMAVLRAIDDPSEDVLVVAALRSPAFGCSDDDLLEWVSAGGRWNPLEPPPPDVAEQSCVADAMATIAEFHLRRWNEGASGIVGRVVRVLRLFEIATADREYRESWKRIRYLLDRARFFSDTAGGSLRDFLEWLEPQLAGRVTLSNDSAVASGDDAVRITTLHASKGLEFPITILAGMAGATKTTTRDRLHVHFSDSANPDYTTTVPPTMNRSSSFEPCRSDGYVERNAVETKMDESEALRLAYVGATRARDHLVVCLHRKAPRSKKDGSMSEVETLASLLDEADTMTAGNLSIRWEPPGWDSAPSAVATRVPSPTEVAEYPGTFSSRRAAWIADREALSARAVREPVLSATRIATLLGGALGTPETTDSAFDYESDDEGAFVDRDQQVGGDPEFPTTGSRDDPASYRPVGRPGRSIGKAVHGVLQRVDLATGADAEKLAIFFAAAEGIPDSAERIRMLVQSVLASETVRAAARSDSCHRELYVASEFGETLVEGYVDLVFVQENGNLCIVDYKTDDISRPGRMEQLARAYAPQCAAYAEAVEAATGGVVDRAVLIFPDRYGGEPVDVPIEDLADERARVRSLAAGAQGSEPSLGSAILPVVGSV